MPPGPPRGWVSRWVSSSEDQPLNSAFLRPVRQGVPRGERPQASHHFRAAAQLNDFSLREKFGFAQCSQKAPENDGKLKPRPDCSPRGTPCRTSFNSDHQIRIDCISQLSRCEGAAGLPLRINQAMLSGGNQSGAFCEQCSSPDFFAQQKNGRVAQQPDWLPELWPIRRGRPATPETGAKHNS